MRLLAPSGCCRSRYRSRTIKLLLLPLKTVVIELAAAALGVEDTATVAAATPKLTFRHYRREAAFDLLPTARGAAALSSRLLPLLT